MKNNLLLFVFVFQFFLIFFSCKKNDSEPNTGNTYYVDAKYGNDTIGDGSIDFPFRTFNRAYDTVKSGDTILMNDGNYGDIVVGRTPGLNWGTPEEITIPEQRFVNWVTVKAAHGANPHFETLNIGTLNIPNSGSPAQKIDFSQKGNCDLYLKFEGITIDDGISVLGSRYLQIKNCIINRRGDLNGSVSNMDNKAGIYILNGRYITLEGNDITHVSIGVAAASYDIVIKNNQIHHNSHDGIRIWGGEKWLIEGNSIHDIDDGVNDDSGLDWNRHVDGIQLWPLIADTKNLTVRGNIFYHIESMGIMTQTETAAESWTFENNIFGPVGGIIFHLGTDVYKSCILRHNTIVYTPNDVWTSIYGRTMDGQQYTLALWTGEWNSWYLFYNNILTTAKTKTKSKRLFFIICLVKLRLQ